MQGDDSRDRFALDYSNKAILAPMVRVGTLPMRLLARSTGADITYSEELIALKFKKVKRVENNLINTIDFVEDNSNAIVYRTCAEDRPNIVQLGAAEPVSALNAATILIRDVDGIDLNCGCPKSFSTQGGMGAALLSKPDTIRDILTTLRRNLPTPNITCKVRLLETIDKTADLLKGIAQTGVPAIAIHGRYVHERPNQPAHWDLLRQTIEAANLSIPIIANGDIFAHEDFDRVKKETGASSVMIARGALMNPSIFSPVARPLEEMIQEYLKIAVEKGSIFANAKYVVQQFYKESGTPLNDRIHRSKSMDALCDYFGVNHTGGIGSSETAAMVGKKRNHDDVAG